MCSPAPQAGLHIGLKPRITSGFGWGIGPDRTPREQSCCSPDALNTLKNMGFALLNWRRAAWPGEVWPEWVVEAGARRAPSVGVIH